MTESQKIVWRSRAYVVILIAFLVISLGMVGQMDYASALEVDAMEKVARPKRAWSFHEMKRPATLRDCSPARLSISYNNGTRAPWRAFCYE